MIVLDQLQQLYIAAGAKAPANDLKTFSDVLRLHANVAVDQFVLSVKQELVKATSAKPSGRKKAPAAAKKASPDTAAINEYVNQLRATGTDRLAFDQALANLKAAKTQSAAEVAEIARQYADTVTKYKSKAVAHSDISKAFVRQARFENKLL